MTRTPDETAAALADDLAAITDPEERYEAVVRTEARIAATMKGARRQIALDLKRTRTWREVGEIMGGVSAQRAEQISRGA